MDSVRTIDGQVHPAPLVKSATRRVACLRRKHGNDTPLHLRSYQLVGRWGGSHIVIDRAGVSNQHASIQWIGSQWILRDLGSRNGTLHNGMRVDPAHPRPLRSGDEIAFGERDEEWVVADTDPPGLLLVPTPPDGEGTIHVDAAEEFRALPSRDDPRLTIVRGADGSWWAELDSGEIVELFAGGIVTLLDRRFEVALPNASDPTGEPLRPLVEHDAAHVFFEIEVSADEETAALAVMHDGWDRPRRIKECVPLYLLAHLVRRRQEEPADGWMDIEAACKALALTREQLGVHVFRVRESLREIGLSQAGSIIERRKGWIRAGIDPSRIRVVRDPAGDEVGASWSSATTRRSLPNS